MSDSASTIVVMNGEATTAGSSYIVFARIGKLPPIIFAMTIVANIDTATIALLCRV